MLSYNRATRRQGRVAAIAVALLASLLCLGCPSKSPTPIVLGGLIVELDTDPARIRISTPDGEVLLEGLGGAMIDPGGDPHSAAAFRSADEEWEMFFGSFRVEEHPGDWKSARVFSSLLLEEDGITFELLEDGGRLLGKGEIREVGPGILRIGLRGTGMDRATAAFRCRPDERFIGFGAMTHDVDHRGRHVPIWVSEQGIGKRDDDQQGPAWFVEGTRHQSYLPIPFFVSSAGYGVLADTHLRSSFDLCREDQEVWRLEAWEGTLSFHLFFGPSPLEVIERHGSVVGRPPVPPPFTFAPWNDAVMGEEKVRDLASFLRERSIPSSAIWTEDWGGGRPVREGEYQLDQNWSVDRGLYPEVEKLAGELDALGFKFLAYFNSFLTEGNDHFAPAMEKGYAIEHPEGGPYLFQGVQFRSTSLVDLTNPEAVAWFAESLNGALDLGFDGWMADYGEWLPTDAVLHSGEDARRVHNLYPLLWQRLNEAVMKERSGDGRDRLFFVRSGYTGSQGISNMVVWAGDQTTDFLPDDGLPTVIPIGIGLGVAGFPYFGHDIAGYYSRPGNPVTKELFFRWTSLGALSPIMRTHHGRLVEANWTLQRDEETISHWARWARLHTRLYPYFLAAAHQAAERSAPIFRALALGYPDDPEAWELKDQYLLGPDILVAPVVSEGAAARDVYFPEGRWVPLMGARPKHPDWEAEGPPPQLPAQETVVGPTRQLVPAPLTEIPAFVRAGGILVLLPEEVQTLAPAVPPVTSHMDIGDDRSVWAYLGASGSFVEADSGLGYHLSSFGAPPVESGELVWNGLVLPTCDVAGDEPCGSLLALDREATARVVGPGTLALRNQSEELASLELEGGAPSRRLELVLRW